MRSPTIPALHVAGIDATSLLNITTAAIRAAVFVFDVVDGALAAGTVVAETTRLAISLLFLSSMLSICKTDKARS